MVKHYDSEKFDVEFKESVSNSFLKTVSAFSNYVDGEIVFGISDKSLAVGIDDTTVTKLQIENMINDTIEPQPNYEISLITIDDKDIVVLHVKKDNKTPYLYKRKAYRRSYTSTIEVDLSEYKRLILEGNNINNEELNSTSQKLSFDVLASELREKINIQNTTKDILKTLGLYNDEDFLNTAAELLADKNNLQFSGVDIAKFGESISQIEHRETISKCSIITQYYRAISIFEQYYKHEKIEGFERKTIERIPMEAFREALANAIVHRNIDIKSLIIISMYNDRIEITSPGGFPRGISKKEYLEGNLSV